MKDGKIFFFVLAGLMMVAGRAGAEEAMRPFTIKSSFISRPVMIKQLYRMAWEHDNDAQMSLTDQIEYFQEHNPGFDEATLAVMKRGTAMMKKMDLGLGKEDLSQKANQIQQSPAKALEDFMDGDGTDNLTTADGLEATDIMNAAEKLKEKMYQNRSLNRTNYQINVDAF